MKIMFQIKTVIAVKHKIWILLVPNLFSSAIKQQLPNLVVKIGFDLS